MMPALIDPRATLPQGAAGGGGGAGGLGDTSDPVPSVPTGPRGLRRLHPSRSLRARFALLLGGSGLALALVTGAVVQVTQRAQLTELQGQAMRRSAVLVARTLDGALQQRLQQLVDTAGHPLWGSGRADPGNVRLLLENLRAQQPALAWIAWVAPDGRVEVATGALLEGANLAAEAWFAPATAAPHIGSRRPAGPLTVLLGLSQGAEPSLIDLGVPLVDMKGRALGVLTARLRWDWLNDQYAALQVQDDHLPGSQTLVLDRGGRVLLGPAAWLDRAPEAGLMPARPQVVDWPDGGEHLTCRVGDGAAAGLSVVMRQPAALAFRPAEALRDRLLAIGGVAMLVFLGLSAWMAARVTRPIAALSAAAHRVTLDQPPDFPPMPPRRQDEVAGLARALAQLHRSLSERLANQQQARAALAELNQQLEQRVAARTAELSAANAELDAFAYAVSHDLRAPLRAMAGFSRALLEDHGPALDAEAQAYLQHIIGASRRMGEQIEGLLTLSRSVREPLALAPVDLSALACEAVDDLRRAEPARAVQVDIQPGLQAWGDRRLLGAVVTNLLANAWKYSQRRADARISFRAEQRDGLTWYATCDNGAGFDMAHAGRLFRAFSRLHRQDEFTGLGIGLATVQRIVQRHGGRIEAEGAPGQGACFRFHLPDRPVEDRTGDDPE